MKNKEFYPTQTIKITSPAACEAVGRIIIDSMHIQKKSVADISYKIVRALGIKLKYDRY